MINLAKQKVLQTEADYTEILTTINAELSSLKWIDLMSKGIRSYTELFHAVEHDQMTAWI